MSFTELPALLGRHFIVGYLVPSLLLMIATLATLANFSIYPFFLETASAGPLVGLGYFALFVYTVAILLLILNRDIIRALEGYDWPRMIQSPFRARQRRTFRRLCSLIDDPANIDDRDKLRRRAVRDFPHDESALLPTKFGNAIRAFEAYPFVVYRFDAVGGGWERLLAVIPNEFKDLIDSSKANMDFWVNAWLGGIIVCFIYVVCAIYTWATSKLWIPLVAIGVSWLSALAARLAAVAWGEMVKSAVDLFLPDLGQKLGFEIPDLPEQRTKPWSEISRSIIYREPVRLSRLAERTCERKEGPMPKDE